MRHNCPSLFRSADESFSQGLTSRRQMPPPNYGTLAYPGSTWSKRQMTDEQRLHRALSLVTGMLDHTTSKGVSARWQQNYPDQYQYAVSLIRRSRKLLAELDQHRIPE